MKGILEHRGAESKMQERGDDVRTAIVHWSKGSVKEGTLGKQGKKKTVGKRKKKKIKRTR